MPSTAYLTLLLLLTILETNSQYCSSLCQISDNTHCLSTSIYSAGCIVGDCATNFFTPADGGTVCSSYLSTVAPISVYDLSSIPSAWTIFTVNTNLTCTIKFTNGPIGSLYTYNFYNKLVGGDYIYNNISINVPHYQIRFRFAITYIGAWSSRDSIWLHTNDTLQTADYNLTYTCVPGNLTFFICSMYVLGDNHVDCMLPYQYAPFHNTSSMLFNFTFISAQTDSRMQFWNLFDFLIVAVKCDISCATCYNGSANACFSCANGFYLTPNNTCTAACTSPLYVLPAPLNPLTGQCVTACPQGYYLNATTCLMCATNCLICTSATLCTLYSPNDPNYQSLWTKYLAVWILLIILGIFLTIAVIWRCSFSSKPIVPVEQAKMIAEQKVYEQRVSVNETMQKQNEINFHIQDIDYQDNVMVDANVRRRKRVEQDMFRTRADF